MSSRIKESEWLTDKGLTDNGNLVRREYQLFCETLDLSNAPSYQAARIKYFLQRAGYWTLPDGFALPPHTINLCVNNICNLRCKYCDLAANNKENYYHKFNVVEQAKKIELPIETCRRIIDEAAWFRPIIRISFREPLLYKDLLPLIQYSKSKQLPVWILTNGINLSKYAEEFIQLGVDSVRLSLDGPCDVHDEIRGAKGAHAKMMEGIKKLIENKKRFNTCTDIGFYFTINDLNYDKMLDTVIELEAIDILKDVFIGFQWLLYTTKSQAEEHNRTHAKITGSYINESAVQNVDLSKIDINMMSSQAKEILHAYPQSSGYKIFFRPSFEKKHIEQYLHSDDFPVENPRCRVLWYNLTINPSGDVKSFHHCLLPEVGNINNESLLDIWNGHTFRSQRVTLQKYGAYAGCSRCWGLYSLLEDEKRQAN